MKPTFFSPSSKSRVRSALAAALLASLAIAAALTVFPATALSQVPPPVNFVSGQLFSGVGHGDRIPGAAGVIAMAVGDFNNDGKLDLITTNSDINDNGLGLVLGNGNGTFQAPIDVAGFYTYGEMGGIVVGDFNKDGNLDFATTWTLGGPVQLGVYLGDGQDHFTFITSYSIGTATDHPPRSIAVADLNGDGKLDLIVPDWYGGAVAVLNGKGDGTFQNPVEFPVAYTPTGVAVGDFNKDGKADIVAALSTGCCPFTGGIGVLINNGNGTFQSPAYYSNPAGVDSGQVAVADLRANGMLDVVECSYGGWNIGVFLGNGDGTFQNAASTYTVLGASSVAIGNLTSDKRPELVVSSYSDGTVWVLLNKGNGVFQVSGIYSTDNGPQSVALADFNGDKKLDFVMGNASGQFVTIGLGNGDGTFRNSLHYNETPGSMAWAWNIAVADFNRDGNPDLVEAGGGTGVGLSLMLGTSHGAPKAPTSINLGANPWAQIYFVLAGDVNGDGKPDIVSSTPKDGGTPGVEVLLGLGTGKFKTPVIYSTSASSYAAVGVLADLNGDGKLDILTSNFDGTMSVLLNKGKGVFGSATVFPSGTGVYPTNFVVGDFTGDGKLDVIVNDYPGSNLKLLRGNGDGTFQSPTVVSSPVRPLAPVVADFNQDGKLDLAIPSTDFGGSMAILLGNGNGTFTIGATYYFYPQDGIHQGQFVPNSGVAVDLNGDGNLDIAIAPGYPSYQVCGGYRCAEQYMGALVFLGKGDGTFVQQSGWLAGVTPAVVAAGDFNSDGMPDLAFLNNNPQGNYWTTSLTILQNATQPVSVSPLSIKYPAKMVGTSNTQTVLLTNDQTISLTSINVTLGGDTGDFSFKSACGSKLLPGARCTISVTFKPTVIGTRTATLFINDSVGTQSVQLSGVGK